MRSLFAVLFLSLTCSFAVADSYETAAVNVSEDGELCIFQDEIGAVGDISICAERLNSAGLSAMERRDLVPANQAKEMNTRIDATIKSIPWIVDALFLPVHKENSSDKFRFTVADFDSFLKKLETGSCGAALTTYKELRNNLNKNKDDITPRNLRAEIAKARSEFVKRCQ